VDDTRALRILAQVIGPGLERIRDLLLRCTDESSLRQFACGCAEYALTATRVNQPLFARGLEVARSLAASSAVQHDLDQLHEDVERLVQEFDNAAFAAQDAANAGTGTREAYTQAFHKARAASAVLRCFEPSASYAAAEACYEAYYATDNINALSALAEEYLA
jgi:hypothetical protein